MIISAFVGKGPTFRKAFGIGTNHKLAKDMLFNILKTEDRLNNYDPDELFYGYLDVSNRKLTIVNRKRAMIIARASNQLLIETDSDELGSQMIDLNSDTMVAHRNYILKLHGNDF